MSIEFSRPAALLLLALVPVFIFLHGRRQRFLPIPGASSLTEDRWWMIGLLPPAMRSISIAALALAAAGPSTTGEIQELRTEGVPIVLAIDISSSMLAQDFRPRDRLSVARTTLASFVDARPNDPIGLVAFAAEAITLVPATAHRGVLENALQSVDVGLLEDGTAVGDGLATAVNRLRGFDNPGIVVLLTDGENNRGTIDPLEAAEAASELDVTVYTVGVGSEGVAPVPIGRAPVGFTYAELPVGLDEDLLRGIAERTNGRYFRATDPEALARIYAEIDRLVPSVAESVRFTTSRDWTGLMLLVALGCLAGEWVVRGSRWGALP